MKYDEIHIENLEFYARHGVFPEETKLGQKFIISLIMYTNTRGAGKRDDLELSVDYGAVSHFITEYMQKNTFKLIEAAAENLARELLLRYPLLEGVELELKKPWAPVGLPLEYVSVKISRFWHKAYLGLGSNMGDKKGYLDYAVKRLNEENGCKVEKVSDYLVTEPYGGVEQDDFLNAVGEITASINNPGPGIVMEASDIVRRVCEPNAIYIYGPTAKFYLEDCKVCLVVVVPSGDVNGIRRRIS